MGKLDGRVALIVGAGTGIGRATALLFAREGAKVVVTMRTEANGRKVVEEIEAMGGEAAFVAGDAGIKTETQRMVAETERLFGRLDILIHNAAHLAQGSVEHLDDAELDRSVDLNFKACFWLVRAALPALKRSPAGRVIVTTTPAMKTAVSGLVAYQATKVGINGFVRATALDLAPWRITVNEVGPGITITEMSGDHIAPETLEKLARLVPLGRLGRPDDIAKGMLFLASDDASYITGQTLVIDGGGTLPHLTEGTLMIT
jgi:3-oxoacyl-[acyl-carrier protein] reductase